MGRLKNDGKGRIGGRKKGTPNKVTASVKEWLNDLINNNREQIEKDLKKITPKERLYMLEKFMQYVVPKQQAVTPIVPFEKLTDAQLDLLISEISKDVGDESDD